MKISLFSAAILILINVSLASGAEIKVKVIGLFADKALLQIGSEQKILSKNETYKGVTLKSASGRGAVVLVNGTEQKLDLNQSIRGGFKKPDRAKSKIYADQQGMYLIYGKINGQRIRFLVDTGATHVTMSGHQAEAIGVDYLKGKKGMARTASGTVHVWEIMLDKVSVGDIRVSNVIATVVPGSEPAEVLLGNSFMKYTKVERSGSVMEIQQRY